MIFFRFNLLLTAATAKPKMHESAKTNTDSINGESNANTPPATVTFAFKKNTIKVGIITISSYINPIAKTPESLADSIFEGGTGRDNNKSLSFA